jgi:hypothetical protein
MFNKKDLIAIFSNIQEEEIANNLKPIVQEEDGVFKYIFEESHFIFINNLTMAFDKVILSSNDLRFYITEIAVGAIAIPNIKNIKN